MKPVLTPKIKLESNLTIIRCRLPSYHLLIHTAIHTHKHEHARCAKKHHKLCRRNKMKIVLFRSRRREKNNDDYESSDDDDYMATWTAPKIYHKGGKHTLISVVAFSFQCRGKICYSFSFCYILVTLQCVVVMLDDWENHVHPL